MTWHSPGALLLLTFLGLAAGSYRDILGGYVHSKQTWATRKAKLLHNAPSAFHRITVSALTQSFQRLLDERLCG
jgi:hypothetical protein